MTKGQLLMEVQSTDISNAFDQYLKAVNDERLARVQYERAKILYDKGAIAKSQLEIAENAEQDAQTDLKAAEQLLTVLGADKIILSADRQGLLPGNRCRHRPKCHRRRRNRRQPLRIGHCVHHRRSLPGLGDLRRL